MKEMRKEYETRQRDMGDQLTALQREVPSLCCFFFWWGGGGANKLIMSRKLYGVESTVMFIPSISIVSIESITLV